MEMMAKKSDSKPKVSCVVPAFSEEETISDVLRVLVNSPLLDEVIVVDDGSQDRTALVVKQNFPQVKLIAKKKNEGKANALLAGAQKARNPILFFCDADLIGLRPFHLRPLIEPVREDKLRMMVGVQEKMNTLRERNWSRLVFGSSKEMPEFIRGLGGEKVLFKKDFLAIPGIKNSGYGVEQKIIRYFKKKNWPFDYYVLRGVGHVWKLEKWGLKGFLKDFKSYLTFGRQYLEGLLAH